MRHQPAGPSTRMGLFGRRLSGRRRQLLEGLLLLAALLCTMLLLAARRGAVQEEVVLDSSLLWVEQRQTATQEDLRGEVDLETAQLWAEELRVAREAARLQPGFWTALQAFSAAMATGPQLLPDFLQLGGREQARGVVTAGVGGGVLTANAFVNLWVLRWHLGSDIPIALAYWGADKCDRIPPNTRAFLLKHIPGLSLLDVSQATFPAHIPPLMHGSFNGYAVKVAALAAAPFREVLWLDSDVMPLQDPLTLFALPQYRAGGALFWPDRYCLANRTLWPPSLNPWRLYAGLGMPTLLGGTYTTEAGQLLLDRARHADVLGWLLWLTAQRDFTYTVAWGDKDTFRAAFHLAGKPEQFAQVEIPVSAALFRRHPQEMFVHRGFVHHHPSTRGALFLHRSADKKYPGGGGGGNLAVSHLLLSPSCWWNAEHWTTRNPAPIFDAHHPPLISTAACNYSMADLRGVEAACARGTADREGPALIEVPEASQLTAAQWAANQAYDALLRGQRSVPGLF